jgi:hypothetical protein
MTLRPTRKCFFTSIAFSSGRVGSSAGGSLAARWLMRAGSRGLAQAARGMLTRALFHGEVAGGLMAALAL